MRNKNLFCGYKPLNITIMRKHLLLSLSLLLSAISMVAQSSTGYIPLVVEDMRWEGEVEVQDWTPELQERHPYTIKIQGDSIINGIQYKKCHYLFSEFNQEPNQYTIVAYLREDISERKVYAIYDSTYMPPINTRWSGDPYDRCLLSDVFNEVLLYDFSNASNPDLFNQYQDTPLIESSEITTPDGVTRKIHRILDADFPNTCYGYFIEGIGYVQHGINHGDMLFRFPVLAACPCNTTIDFHRFYDENGTLIFSPKDAENAFNGVESIAVDSDATIINIGAGVISTCREALIEIVDLNGRKVASTRGTSLSTSALPAGIYIVKATTASTTQTAKVIVK